MILKISTYVVPEFDGPYDPYSGITNNLSESYNAVMKQENDWKGCFRNSRFDEAEKMLMDTAKFSVMNNES
jgi:hypothetical protein